MFDSILFLFRDLFVWFMILYLTVMKNYNALLFLMPISTSGKSDAIWHAWQPLATKFFASNKNNVMINICILDETRATIKLQRGTTQYYLLVASRSCESRRKIIVHIKYVCHVKAALHMS